MASEAKAHGKAVGYADGGPVEWRQIPSRSSHVMTTSTPMMDEWNNVSWPSAERAVFKLQKRIYQASRRNDVRTVHRLQRLLIGSHAAALLAVRRVTQENAGKRTPGVDGIASLADAEKSELVHVIRRDPLPGTAQPVRRVWIPKPGSDEQRPLGIPVMEDRARQMLAKMVLEPEWEARFEPNSFGFRPGRSCHDAIRAIYDHIRLVPKFVLDADIAKCFDRIDHEALLNKLGTFPQLRRMIRAWLKAGILDGGELFPTPGGTPQGGVISPLLANVALHGLATAVESAFQQFKHPPGAKRIPWKPTVIRYADDFVILHRDLDALKEAYGIAAEWLKGMGLEMKPSKTRFTHTLTELDGHVGFDFLGFHVRQFSRGRHRGVRSTRGVPAGFTPSIRPSPGSQKRFLQTVRDLIRGHRNVPQVHLVRLLNPVLRGWGNYFSAVVSKKAFAKMDLCIFRMLWSWATFRHPNKGRRWVARKYWLLGTRGWTFGIEGKITLHKLAEIPIRRHVKVVGDRSPFDGDAIYWSTRVGTHPELPRGFSKSLKAQRGRCARCGQFLKPGDELAYVDQSKIDGRPPSGSVGVGHSHCHPSAATIGMSIGHHSTEEPDEGKLSRPVLKTSAGSDTCA
jgi:RNA-directed DNA polymerase